MSTGIDVQAGVAGWHGFVADPQPDRLREMIDDAAVFKSPAVHTPQRGREKVFAYLWAAIQVLGPTIEYGRQWTAEDSAVLGFTAVVDRLDVEGVDVITWNEQGRIVDFTVLVRPYKGLGALIGAMGLQLASDAS